VTRLDTFARVIRHFGEFGASGHCLGNSPLSGTDYHWGATINEPYTFNTLEMYFSETFILQRNRSQIFLGIDTNFESTDFLPKFIQRHWQLLVIQMPCYKQRKTLRLLLVQSMV
jgi:hypothetical protein